VPSHLKHRIEFAGFQPVERLPQFFAAADIFVLPSLHDGWGVVVNQALAAGLPIICSSAVGAACDLVTPGWNGSTVAPGDSAALADAIRALAADVRLRQAFGENSRRRAADWTLERGVDRWVELAERVLTRESVRATGHSIRPALPERNAGSLAHDLRRAQPNVHESRPSG
jgi:glycosyltransferase involved in cell wall biosynthesis